MFSGITTALSDAFKSLRGRGRLTETNIREGLEQVRRALLDADVNYAVVNSFIERVSKKALGQDVLKTIDPSEQIVKIVYDELVALMGPVDHNIRFVNGRPTVIMLCGLQGSGKTTTCGKLALMLGKTSGRKVLLVAADLQRPAAVEQLRTISEQVGVPFYSEAQSNPVAVCRNAVEHARKSGCDTVILDTAGRLHVDGALMEELKQIDRQAKPDEIFFVCDSMTGQDAVNSAKAFNDALELNGVILTKLDGDTRGGAALSIKDVAKVPIKFIGVGEKMDCLEKFHPDRMAQRILGQGDLMSLVEKVQAVQGDMDEATRRKEEEKLSKGDFTLVDYRKQIDQMAKLGVRNVLGSLPGMSQKTLPEGEEPEAALKRMRGMIDSMTQAERRNPNLIDTRRRARIARGAGVQPHEVGKMLKQFEGTRTQMKAMSGMSAGERMKMLSGLGKPGAAGKMQGASKVGTGHRKSAKERAADRKNKRRR